MFRIFIIFSISLSFASIFGQNKFETEKRLFDSALTNYKNKNYERSQLLFNQLLKADQADSELTIRAAIFLGKVLLEQNKFSKCVSVLQAYNTSFQDDLYFDEIKTVLAAGYFGLGEIDSCLFSLFSIIISSKEKETVEVSKKTFEDVAISKGNVKTLKRFTEISHGKSAEPFMNLVLGKKYLEMGDNPNALKSFFYVILNFMGTVEYSEADKLRNLSPSKKKEQVFISEMPVIAVLLPLLEQIDSLQVGPSYQILAGIKLAVENYNSANPNKKIGLVIRDTKREKKEIEKIYSELRNIKSIKAIIGPLFSDETDIVCKVFKGMNIPIISPTATDDSLSIRNINFYQANPSFKVRGKIAAQYLYNKVKKRKMGVFYCSEGYSSKLASAFMTEFKRLGGVISFEEIYSEEIESFETILTKMGSAKNVLDGVYIPISEEQITNQIISGMTLFNNPVQLFGNDDWLNTKALRAAPEICNRFTIFSDSYVDYFDSNYVFNKSKFEKLTGFFLDKPSLYGFDLTNYLIEVFKITGNNDDLIKKKLDSGFEVDGFHNAIEFGRDRINPNMNVLKYEDGRIRFLQRYKLKN